MTKTIREWLLELPEPYRSLALKNMFKGDREIDSENEIEALRAAFTWAYSPQGYEYWRNLKKALFDKYHPSEFKKSNREIAEEIYKAIDNTLATESEVDVIETILNKYL